MIIIMRTNVTLSTSRARQAENGAGGHTPYPLTAADQEIDFTK